MEKIMHQHIKVPQEIYNILGKTEEERALRARLLLAENFLEYPGIGNWLQEVEEGGYLALTAFKSAARLYRPANFGVAAEVKLTFGDLEYVASASDNEVEAWRIVRQSHPGATRKFFETAQAIRGSAAWTRGFRPPWPAVVSVARIARLLTWPAPAPAVEPTAAVAEPTAAPTVAPAAKPAEAPAAKPAEAPVAKPAPAAKPAVAPAAAKRPRKRAR